MWRIPSAPPGFFPLGKSLHGSEVMGAYFVSNVQFCEVYYVVASVPLERNLFDLRKRSPDTRLKARDNDRYVVNRVGRSTA